MQELPAYMLVAIFHLIFFFHVEQYNESNNRETMQCKVKVLQYQEIDTYTVHWVNAVNAVQQQHIIS